MGEKKRKRNEDGGERPTKKTAITQPQGNLKVELVENKDTLGPILGAMLIHRDTWTMRTNTLDSVHARPQLPT
jgi:hypothetical protein